MCLTLANATSVCDHQDSPPPARGYTRTQHHAGYLAPGDLWRPDDDTTGQENPRTVMAVGHHLGQVVLTDQYGIAHRYPPDAVISTAVADAWTFPRIKRWN
jgi:hypothetical protein